MVFIKFLLKYMNVLARIQRNVTWKELHFFFQWSLYTIHILYTAIWVNIFRCCETVSLQEQICSNRGYNLHILQLSIDQHEEKNHQDKDFVVKRQNRSKIRLKIHNTLYWYVQRSSTHNTWRNINSFPSRNICHMQYN